jgi:hypothetical protein
MLVRARMASITSRTGNTLLPDFRRLLLEDISFSGFAAIVIELRFIIVDSFAN